KRLERSMIQQKLDQKIEQQLAAEPGRQLRNDPDAVAPLVPAIPEEEKHYQEVEQNLILVPAEVGRNIPLNSVVFEEASDHLKPGAYAELNRLLAFLNQHANLVVEVGAHVDQSFSYARALEVTEQRAQVVTGFLIGNGIASKRLESKGYGKAFPAVSPSSSERIEIRIIGKH
ncbi:MAG: OmpA family protein, partial [Mameliella sp.]|nr:OmpA family protein [Phaeodactylibacter sp.]